MKKKMIMVFVIALMSLMNVSAMTVYESLSPLGESRYEQWDNYMWIVSKSDSWFDATISKDDRDRWYRVYFSAGPNNTGT